MASNQEQETIDLNYIIQDKKGHGKTGNVYKVKDRKTDKLFAAKVFMETSPCFHDEVEALKHLKDDENAKNYISNIITSGEGLIIRKNQPQTKSQFIILEYIPKGDLIEYIFYPKKPFSELHSKYIFKKILKGVEACHKAGICHRDLKLENILVNDDYNPIICDFGFATKNDHPLKESLGTEKYAAPEMYKDKPYDGFKADIFSLGVILLGLNTCKFGFHVANVKDIYYMEIIRSLASKSHLNTYWDMLQNETGKLSISKELKDLYIKMISYRQKDRPSFQDIYDSDWMKEIQDMNEEQLDQLEAEVKEEFMNRWEEIKEGKKREEEVEKLKNTENIPSYSSGDNKGMNDKKNAFDLDIKPDYAQTGLNMENYIKINGKMNPSIFMDGLISEIKKEFKDNCNIPPLDTKKLKFKVAISTAREEIYEIPEDVKEELKQIGIDDLDEIEIEDYQKIKGKNIVVKIKIFESYNGGYLLAFAKKDGNKIDYLDNVEKISSLVKNII